MAGETSIPDLTADQKAEVARFGIHDDPVESPWDPPETEATMAVEAFIVDQNITRGDLAELLREYRSETGMSPFEWGERDTLDDQFLNWHRWERLA